MIEPPIDERYELAAVKDSLTPDERTTAEKTYTRRAFDYEQNPVGSRDWTLFWSGWCARATQPVKAQPPCGADGVVTFALDYYDAGLLGDGGGGNVEWWQDYMRSELSRAHDCYQSQIDANHQPAAPVAPATVAVPDEVMAALDSGFMLSTHYGQQAGQPMPVSDSRTLIRFARAMRHLGMIEAAKIADNCDKSTHPADVAEAIREAVRVEG